MKTFQRTMIVGLVVMIAGCDQNSPPADANMTTEVGVKTL